LNSNLEDKNDNHKKTRYKSGFLKLQTYPINYYLQAEGRNFARTISASTPSAQLAMTESLSQYHTPGAALK